MEDYFDVEEKNIKNVLQEFINNDVTFLSEIPIEDLIDSFKNTFYTEDPLIFSFSTEELTLWFNERVQELLDDTLRQLVKENKIDMSVDESGEFYFHSK